MDKDIDELDEMLNGLEICNKTIPDHLDYYLENKQFVSAGLFWGCAIIDENDKDYDLTALVLANKEITITLYTRLYSSKFYSLFDEFVKTIKNSKFSIKSVLLNLTDKLTYSDYQMQQLATSNLKML